MDIDAVVLEKINNDSEFQTILESLPEEERESTINTKKAELIKSEFESLAKKAQENEQKFNDQKTRAEKAEELAKKNKGKEKDEKTDSSITARDVLILSGAGVTNEEDIEVVEKWAKFNGTGIRDALNDSTLKTVLATKQEERRTALATSSKGGARGSSTPSIEAILSEASKGKLPENDSEIAKLAEARMLKRLEGK